MVGEEGKRVQRKESLEKLKGITLRAHWIVLNSGSGGVGPREVQRALRFSSPGSAVYQLEKLVNMGLKKEMTQVIILL